MDLDKIIGKNISKNLSDKYSEKHLDLAKEYAIDVLGTTTNRKNSRSNWIFNF